MAQERNPRPKSPKRKPPRGMRPLGPAPRQRNGEPPKKEMGPMRPLKPAPRRTMLPKIRFEDAAMREMTQSKRMTKQAQSIAMEKVKKKRSTAADSKRKTGQAIDMLGKKKAAPSRAIPKGFKRMQQPKKKQGR